MKKEYETLEEIITGITDQVLLVFLSLKALQERIQDVEPLPPSSQDDKKQWFSRKEVAKYLGISVQTLCQWAWKGKGIPYTKVGNMVRYKREDVKQFLLKNNIK